MGSLWNLWHIWLHGSTTDKKSLQLWHHSVLFWGRFGKLPEFAGVLTAIVELILQGPLKHLRDWAKSGGMKDFTH